MIRQRTRRFERDFECKPDGCAIRGVICPALKVLRLVKDVSSCICKHGESYRFRTAPLECLGSTRLIAPARIGLSDCPVTTLMNYCHTTRDVVCKTSPTSPSVCVCVRVVRNVNGYTPSCDSPHTHTHAGSGQYRVLLPTRTHTIVALRKDPCICMTISAHITQRQVAVCVCVCVAVKADCQSKGASSLSRGSCNMEPDACVRWSPWALRNHRRARIRNSTTRLARSGNRRPKATAFTQQYARPLAKT